MADKSSNGEAGEAGGGLPQPLSPDAAHAARLEVIAASDLDDAEKLAERRRSNLLRARHIKAINQGLDIEQPPPLRRKAGGRFATGVKAGPGRPKGSKDHKPRKPNTDAKYEVRRVECPPDLRRLLRRDRLLRLYNGLFRKAAKGDGPANTALMKMIAGYAGERAAAKTAEADDDASAAYHGLPDEAAALCLELDIGLAEVMNRRRLGLPLAPIERLIGETAAAVAADGPGSPSVTRWRDILIREVATMEEREAAATPPSPPPDNTSQRGGGPS